MPVIVYSRSAVPAVENSEIHTVDAGVNLGEWLRYNGYLSLMHQHPIIVLLNGRELMQSEYDDIVLAEDDKVALAGKSEAVAIFQVLMIVAFAATVAMYLTMPEPENPNVDTAEGSPTYSLSARGNRARMGQPKPVLYGEFVTYPDLSAELIPEYDHANNQIVTQIFEITEGECTVDMSTAKFEDTLLSSFDNVETEIVVPGQKSTLFPLVIDSVDAVSSLDLKDVILGPYTINEIGTEATGVAFDFAARAGIYGTDEKGNLYNYSVQYRMEALEIDDLDAPVGSWFLLGTETMTGYERDPIRKTHKYTLSGARYQVRVTRITAENDSIRISDDVTWQSVKAYIGDSLVTTTTRVAVRVQSSEQLGNKSLSLFNVKSKRKLRTWNSTTGWDAEVETNNPIWAFVDACTADHGGKRSDAHVDLLKCEQYAAILDAEGIEFNGVFDTETTLFGALKAILMPAKCIPIDIGGIYSFSRDEADTVPVQMFTMRNIIKDSFSIKNVGVLDETSDSIRAFFFDKDQGYRKTSFIESLPGGTTNNPKEVELFGITDKDIAHNIVMYMLAQNFYRRQRITFETGLEGRIPGHYDLISISHYLTGVDSGTNIVGGDIVSTDGDRTITLSEYVDELTDPYIIIRDNYGEQLGPYTFSIISPTVIYIDDAGFSPSLIEFEAGKERPQFSAGDGTQFMTFAKVTNIEPSSDQTVKIECFIDASEVYSISDGIPVPPINQLPAIPGLVPTVSNLLYAVRGDQDNPTVVLTWVGSKADYYVVEYSVNGTDYYDAGNNTTKDPRFEFIPGPAGVYYFRVAGYSIFKGAWETVTVDTNTTQLETPQDPTALALREAFDGPTLKLQWLSDTIINVIEFWDGATKRYSDVVEAQQYDLKSTTALENGLPRGFDVRVYAMSESGKLSLSYASLSVSNTAPAALANLAFNETIDNAIVTFDQPSDTDFNGVSIWGSPTTGFSPTNSNLVTNASFDPVLGVATDVNHFFIVAATDTWGDTGLNYSGEYEANPSEISGVRITDDTVSGEKLLANSVTADKAFITELSALTANAGTVTAGTVATAAGTAYRAQMTSDGDYPFGIGDGVIDSTSEVSYNKVTGAFAIKARDGSARLLFNPGSNYPFTVQGGGTIGNSSGNYIAYNLSLTRFEAPRIYARGDIEATTISVTSANIVSTLNLQGNAVTIPEASYAESDQSVGTSWVTLRSKSIVSVGQAVMVSCAGIFSGQSNYANVRILRGATTIYDTGSLGLYLAEVALPPPIYYLPVKLPQAFSMHDTPPAGTQTYYFQAKVNTETAIVRNRSLSLIGTKGV